MTLSNVFESQLVLGSSVSKSAVPMGLTPATKDREPVHGQLVLVNNDGCHDSDYPTNVKGNIAFIRRGACAFGDKSIGAGKAGAKAAVIYNTDPEELHGTLGEPTKYHVATFGIDGTEGSAVAEKLANGESVSGIAYIDAEVKQIQTVNVLAQTDEGDPDNCVMLGGHSDGVAEGPGINDDGSGSMSVLEVAVQLTKFKVNNCVRFAWWAAEEEGLLGSDFYAASLSEEENQKIRLFMDYDMSKCISKTKIKESAANYPVKQWPAPTLPTRFTMLPMRTTLLALRNCEISTSTGTSLRASTTPLVCFHPRRLVTGD